MNIDFSQAAANRAAAIEAVHHIGNRVEVDTVRRMVSAPLHVGAQNLHDQAAGYA